MTCTCIYIHLARHLSCMSLLPLHHTLGAQRFKLVFQKLKHVFLFLLLLCPLPLSLLCRQGRCKLSVMGRACEVGLRRRHYYILSGSVLGVWTHLEAVLARHSGHNNRMQIARVQTSRKRLVGEWLPSQHIHIVCNAACVP